MTRSRLREVQRLAPRASDKKLRSLYEEVIGGTPAASIPTERVRESLKGALAELLEGIADGK